ncbi:MAG: DUF4296 domain-containing protein [Tannerella sp.]|jgi:hypothetical protein|nr:DUF4296 domain-containing protein [Tannerella sp.]
MSKTCPDTRWKRAVCFAAILLSGCSRTPDGIIPEKKMKEVMVDVQLAEAMIYTEPAAYPTAAGRRALYRSVFGKHRLTEAEYDSSMIWYGKHLERYMRIYNLALADVRARMEAIGDVKPDIAPASNADSLDLWVFRKYYAFSPRSLSRRVIFDFRPDEPYSSGSVFVLGWRAWGLAPDMQASVEAHLRAHQGDTTLSVKSTAGRDGRHEIYLKTIPTRRVDRVYGYIWLNTADTAFHHIYLDDFSLMKYRYGSPAIEAMDSLLRAVPGGTVD